ncbi:hypothetical protein [Flavobacterium sp.]|uniref:hypothetical protein n=1 Tax=Flavobacterium sp. TaxID=239 RepID=UPI002489535B|nr:hypothetical protein [Flavobacterium sp.]MDI1316850.1 hypothetical protein [Flavobacterium sp.]
MKKELKLSLILLLTISINTYSQSIWDKVKKETKKVDSKVLVQAGAEVVNQITKKSTKKSDLLKKDDKVYSCSEIFGFENNTVIEKIEYFKGTLMEQANIVDNINSEIKNNNNFNGQIKINEELKLKMKNNISSYVPFLSMTVSDLEQKNNRSKLCEIYNTYKQNEIEVQLLLSNFSQIYQNEELIKHNEVVSNLKKEEKEKEKIKQKEIEKINQENIEREKHVRERCEWSKTTKPFNLPYQRKFTTSYYQCKECKKKHEVTQLKISKYPNYSKTDSPSFAEESFTIMYLFDAMITNFLANDNSIKKSVCEESKSGKHEWAEINTSDEIQDMNYTNKDAATANKCN